MPKRPTRVLRSLEELPVPPDLRGAGPTLAYEGGGGALWHADALALLGRLPDGSVDLVVADPPYAIAKESWDEFDSLDDYVAWCDAWLAEVARVLAPHGSAYVCGFSEILADVKARSARRFASCRWLVWYYRNKANLGRDWGRSHESILHLRHERCTRIDVDAVRVPYNGHTTRYPARVQAVNSQYGKSGRRDRWEPNPLGAKPRDVLEVPVICNGMTEKTPHATQKPEALIEKLVSASSAPGQLVVDPFVGSGTTAVVAARLGRRWLAGDADARYVGLTRDRLGAPRPEAPRSPPEASAAPSPRRSVSTAKQAPAAPVPSAMPTPQQPRSSSAAKRQPRPSLARPRSISASKRVLPRAAPGSKPRSSSTAKRTPAAGRASGAPAAERASGAPAARRASGAPAAERASGVPAAERASGAPAAERASGAPAAERASGAPAAERASGAPAAERASGATVARPRPQPRTAAPSTPPERGQLLLLNLDPVPRAARRGRSR